MLGLSQLVVAMMTSAWAIVQVRPTKVSSIDAAVISTKVGVQEVRRLVSCPATVLINN